MDTNSNYIAIFADRLEDIARPELRAEFETMRQCHGTSGDGARRGFSSLNAEAAGKSRCVKCYYADEQENVKKFRKKSMSKRQNNSTWQHFKAALNGRVDRTEGRRIRTFNGQMATYEQQKLGLRAYYDKDWVLWDGIHTEPIAFHMI